MPSDSTSPDRTSLDWNTGELAAGLSCYRRGEFWAAHEHWENIWRQCRGPEKSFLQALIQVAGALHHHRRNNRRGAVALLQSALRRLEAYPERYGGLLLAPLRQELNAWLAALEAHVEKDAAAILLPYPRMRPEIADPHPTEPAP
jgi:uncharacterized protein